MPPYPVHLCVVLHGLWGNPSHIGYVCRSLAAKAGASSPQSRKRATSPTRSTTDVTPTLVVLPAKLNAETRTYDGIDLCAERVVQEIDEELKRIEEEGGKVERFSIVGYSLGGLVARYVLGLLESRTPSFFADVRPVNFTTFASPAIGIPRYDSTWSRIFRFLGARLLSRSGSQLYENDRYLVESSLIAGNNQHLDTKCPPTKNLLGKLSRKKEKAEPLLSVMADPKYSFFKALSAFERVEIYANTVNDRTVPFPTGAIEIHDPFALARAKAQKVASARGDDPDHPLDIRDGGLEVILEDGAAIIKSFEPCTPPSPSASVPSTSTSKKSRRWPRLPLLLRPTTYPFSRPVSLLVIVALPVALPLCLVYLVGRFMVQNRSSRRRIRDMRTTMGGGREGMLERVGVKLREVAENVGGADNPEYALGLDTPASGAETPNGNGAAEDLAEAQQLKQHPAFQALASYGGTDTPPLSRPLIPLPSSSSSSPSGDLSKPLPTDPILSPAQLKMIENLNSIPQMRKHFVYLPNSRNSHGAICARDPTRFAQHRPGMKIVDKWAEEFRI
ncbi:putative serine esterase-domain-containing protein [Leucosporidium creatinivorum]|uniref:Putative serine esterase-domain-containing protein n=1 Tax=Leucosporidium creatinivorum TaxID=106004 RepID=A0A1Y2G231_9BASI|nr:putative serine esterase-domain-containing protein [Leucosporidium creatinivorum]